jgi:hypothetical protein
VSGMVLPVQVEPRPGEQQHQADHRRDEERGQSRD